MKENENLLKWFTSIMTIPLSSVILFFFRKNLHVVYHGRRQFIIIINSMDDSISKIIIFKVIYQR